MAMTIEQLELVRHAKDGDIPSLEKLAEVVRPQLFAYIYRLTLDQDLSQDLTQDTLLDMVKSLWRLEKARKFQAWLFRTALGKVQHHYRDKKKGRKIQMSAIEREHLLDRASFELNDGLSYLQRKELSDVIFEAMKKLRMSYRNILTLRCLEQMSYSEIAMAMDCSEIQSRVLFYRAKKSLRKQLYRHGYSKNALLTGIGLFGLITAPAELIPSVPAVTITSMKVGMIPSIIGAITSNVGLALTATATVFAAYITIKNIVIVIAILAIASLTVLINCFLGTQTD
jgi:RNA polymerase sigma-70 factor (ECF subfamily)